MKPNKVILEKDLNTNLKKAISCFQKVMESEYVAPAFFVIMVLFWIVNLTYVSVFIMAASVAAIFLACKDLKNIFVPLLFICFFINDIEVEANIVLYAVAVGIIVLAVIEFVVLKLIKERKTLKKGNMFWAFVVSSIAFLLGGCVGNFNLLAFGAVAALCVITYFLYWVAINFCTNLRQHLFKIAMYGAVSIAVVIFVSILRAGGLYQALVNRAVTFIGAQHVNVSAVFITIGIIGTLAFGYKNKFDYLFFALAFVLLGVLALTCSRLMMVLGFLSFVSLSVLMIVKSRRKRNFVWVGIAVCVVSTILCLVLWKDISAIISEISSKMERGTNGRSELWPWCIERFKENPVFGYGFVSKEPVPTIRNTVQLVLAHNTAIQWLASLGIFGSILMLYFYYKKYQIVFTRPLAAKIFLIYQIIVVEISGIFDQAATMDLFTVVFICLCIAACEKETPNIKKTNLIKCIKKKKSS